MSASPHADPGRGVFETMLVLAGRPIELDAHLARLGASLVALYGMELPVTTRATVLDHADGLTHGRLRLTAKPHRGQPELRIATRAIDPDDVFPGPERGVSLRSVTAAGGLGEHKWADRRLLDRAAAAAPSEMPLLLDADGSVLEAARGSVFAVRDERLSTPPTDGRILLSIARRQTIEVAHSLGIEVREERVTLVELRECEVFLAGSVRGIEPALTLDGQALPLPGELGELIRDGLRNRRLGTRAAALAASGAGARPTDPRGR